MDIDALWDFGDPAATEARMRLALETASPQDRLELTTQIARTYSLRKEFNKAHETLNTLPTELPPRAAVRMRLERGRTHNSAGEKDLALPCFESAYTLAREVGEDALAVDAAHMVAIVMVNPEDQIRWNHLGLELAGASIDPKAQKWRASLLNNLGWTLHDQGRYNEALTHFEEARHLREVAGQTSQERIARWTIARCLRSLGRVEEALTMQRALKVEDPDDPYIDEEIAACEAALQRTQVDVVTLKDDPETST